MTFISLLRSLSVFIRAYLVRLALRMAMFTARWIIKGGFRGEAMLQETINVSGRKGNPIRVGIYKNEAAKRARLDGEKSAVLVHWHGMSPS